MSYSLLVIDLQNYFEASRGIKVQRNCMRELKQAIKDKAAILLVEFDGYGPTQPNLTKVINDKNYKRAFQVLKSHDDGGKEVYEKILEKKLPKQYIKVTGCNTEYCVLSTVKGLLSKLPKSKVEIIGDACASNNNHRYGLSVLKQIPNVKVNSK